MNTTANSAQTLATNRLDTPRGARRKKKKKKEEREKEKQEEEEEEEDEDEDEEEEKKTMSIHQPRTNTWRTLVTRDFSRLQTSFKLHWSHRRRRRRNEDCVSVDQPRTTNLVNIVIRVVSSQSCDICNP